MSIIHVNQIRTHILKKFDGLLDLSDLVAAPIQQKENFQLSRSLAAYAVQYLAQTDFQSAAESVTDGADDNGIDAIFVDEREKTLYLVQSKWIHNGQGEPDSGEIKKFIAGIKDLFNNRFERFNSKIDRKKDQIRKILLDPYSKYIVVLIYTGVNPLSSHSKRDFDDLLDEINDAGEILSVKIMTQSQIHSSLTAGIAGEPIVADIGIKSWGRIENPYTAYYGQFNAMQVFELWKNHQNKLFTRNLRSFIGDTDVNNEMRETIEKNPDHFWYYNNGITIISKRIKKSVSGGSEDFGLFRCEDLHVVNGAQTVSTIGRVGEKSPEKLREVYVPLRIISLEHSDEPFGDIITKTNNRQNRIENRDFVNLDPEQTRICDELKLDGIEYNVMRTESFVPSTTSFDVVESTTALACAYTKVSIVVQLKREIGRLWEDINKPPYKELFNPSVSGMYIWRCVRVQRKIDKELEKISKDSSLSGRDAGIAIHGNRLIAAMVFLKMESKKFSDFSFDYDAITTDVNVSNFTIQYFTILKDFIELKYENAIIPTLFKNLSKCKNLFQLCTDVNYDEHQKMMSEYRQKEQEKLRQMYDLIEHQKESSDQILKKPFEEF